MRFIRPPKRFVKTLRAPTHPHLILILVLVLALVLLGSAGAAPNEHEEIQALYRRGLAGNAAAVEECIVKLERVLTTEPANQLARVYLGSSYTLRSRDLGFGPRKLATLKRGLAIMDEAVAAAPRDPQVRLARALTTDALPKIFGRASESRKDFEMLASLAEAEPQKFDEGELQTVFYYAGRAAEAQSDHVKTATLWKKALQHPGNPELAGKIHAALKQLPR